MLFFKKDQCQIWLMGGLGNQLFQINYGKWLSDEKKLTVEYNTYLLRSNIATNLLKWTVHDFFLESVIDFDLKLMEKRNFPALMLAKTPILNSYARYSDLNVIPKSDQRNLFGYFQNQDFLEATRGNLSLKSEVCAEHLKSNIVMHVRGGDMNERRYGLSYYCTVLNQIPASTILVVTDCLQTLDLLKNRFNKHDLVDISNSAKQDFLVCCNAEKLITAPSTFSWWAARLGRSKEVVLPSKTYTALGSPMLDKNIIVVE